MSNRINLLILTSKPDEAAGLVTLLRNGGLPVQGIHTHHPERLGEVTRDHQCDLVLCCTYDPKIDLGTVMTQYRRHGLDIPLILIGEADADPEPLMQAMRSGARDLAERNDATHLQLVVARELKDLEQRRALAEARARLEHCEQRIRDLVNASTEPFAFVQQGMHVLANPAYQHLFGFALEENIEGTPVIDLVSPDHHGSVRAFLRDQDTDRGEASLKHLPVTWLHSDGSGFAAELYAAQAEMDGEHCLRLTLKLRPEPGPGPTAQDIDPDTALPSRRALLHEVSRRLAADTGVTPALLYIDALDLDRIAQRDGLSAALTAAAALARSLSGLVPEGGYLARIGDAAFAILFEGRDPQEARTIANGLAQRIGLALGTEADSGGPRCAVGLSLAGPEVSSASVLLDTAYGEAQHKPAQRPPPPRARAPLPDLTLEPVPGPSATPAARAVHAGHPVGPVPAPYLTQSAARPARATQTRPVQGMSRGTAAEEAGRRMVALLDQALGRGPAALRLVYQPIVSLMGDSQENYSVLVRLLDSDGVPHEAKEFIGVAAASGRLAEIDRWVVSHAVAELAKQRTGGHRFNFFVNISEASLQDEALLAWICDHLRDLDVRGSWLTFQFALGEACRNRPALTRLVEGLRQIKCRIALTRCGTLDDSQELMQQLPIDFLLFAQDFAQGLAEDKAKQADLIAFVGLGHERKVKSIVTGVEDPRALTVLWTAGVDFVQGNFLQTPSPTIELKG
ncbi:MAG TPA: EAL domain-containing protein [Chromatiaceae bacterium]|nr:EAL domain-containing protein [Chromatiaceae bacterium]